jgi:hypothetical protein
LKVAFSPNGQFLAAGGGDGKSGEVKIWDAASGRERLSLKHAGCVEAVVFSPDMRRLATASRDNKVRVWDLDSGKELFALKGHRHPVSCLAFSPDGQRLASGGTDNTLKIWDAENGQELLSLSGHAYSIRSLTFSPDCKWLASGDNSGTVRIWAGRAPTPEALQQRTAYRIAEMLVESLFGRLVTKSAVLESLRQDSALSEALRTQALDRAERYPQDILALTGASWEVVRAAGASAAAYKRALVEAEEACRLLPKDAFPDKAVFVNSLGAAQYRNGKYDIAMKSLSQAASLFSTGEFKAGHPANLAFLAMTQHKLGHAQKARANFDRARELMQQRLWQNGDDSKAIIAEAEKLLEKGK